MIEDCHFKWSSEPLCICLYLDLNPRSVLPSTVADTVVSYHRLSPLCGSTPISGSGESLSQYDHGY